MSSRSLIVLVPALLLAACGTQNPGLESVHQPVVSRSDYSLDLVTAGYALAPGETERLAGWMASMRLAYGDRVALDDPEGAEGVREAVAQQVARHGLLLADETPVTPGQIGPGTVRVVVTRMTATVPGCPDFSRIYQPDYRAHTGSNYGCANNSNLAAMIANPADLVRGQPGSGTADPLTNTKAIQSFRKTAPSGAGGLKSESPGGGSQ